MKAWHLCALNMIENFSKDWHKKEPVPFFFSFYLFPNDYALWWSWGLLEEWHFEILAYVNNFLNLKKGLHSISTYCFLYTRPCPWVCWKVGVPLNPSLPLWLWMSHFAVMNLSFLIYKLSLELEDPEISLLLVSFHYFKLWIYKYIFVI